MVKEWSAYKAIRRKYHHLRWSRQLRKEYQKNREFWGKEYADICMNCEKALRDPKSTGSARAYAEKKTDYIRSILAELSEH